MLTGMRYAVILLLLACITSPLNASSQFSDRFDEETLFSNLDRYERNQYEGLRYLMNDHQKIHYLKLPTRKERDEWLIKFWRMNDPTPSTRINERRVEHDTRVATARELYARDGIPGWDRRGETFVRFGKPDYVADVSGLVNENVQKGPGEVWHYYQLGIVVPFEDPFLNGEYTYFMEVATATTQYPHEMLTDEYGQITEWYQFSPSNIYGLYFGPSDELMKFYSLVENNRYFHSVDVKRPDLPCYFDITAFKSDKGKVRTDVSFEIPAKELSYTEVRDGWKTDFEASLAVYDIEMNEIVTVMDTVRIELPEKPEPDSPWLLPGQFTLILKPGYYRFGLELKDTETKKHGVYLSSRLLLPFGDSLAMSDVQLASYIEETGRGSRPSFIKGPLRVIPHPIHAYWMPDQVKFYFEIYGLDVDDEDFAFWEIEYSVEPKKGKKRKGTGYEDVSTDLSSKFATSGFGSRQTQRLEIETKNLWEGSFRMTVRVMDRRTRKSVEKIAYFSILE